MTALPTNLSTESKSLSHRGISCARVALDVPLARLFDYAQPEGLAVWQNNGVAADQTIPHVHFHVAGTLAGGGTERGRVDEISVAETDVIAGRLRLALPA